MKIIGSLLLLAFLVSSNGCMTYSSIQRAEGRHNVLTGDHPGEPQSEYYALLPLTVAADAATSPIQLILYLLMSSQGGF